MGGPSFSRLHFTRASPVWVLAWPRVLYSHPHIGVINLILSPYLVQFMGKSITFIIGVMCFPHRWWEDGYWVGSPRVLKGTVGCEVLVMHEPSPQRSSSCSSSWPLFCMLPRTWESWSGTLVLRASLPKQVKKGSLWQLCCLPRALPESGTSSASCLFNLGRMSDSVFWGHQKCS